MMKYTVDGDLVPAHDMIDNLEHSIRRERAHHNKEIHSIERRLSIVEDMLCILNRDLDYEDQYPELREAFDQYNRILAKYRTFNVLTKDGDNK